jgi:peptide/nickel transport system substrate-binding protein
MKKSICHLVILAFFSVMVLAASSTQGAPRYGGILKINQNGGASGRQIAAPADTPQALQRYARMIFDPLLTCDVKEQIKPWLAESYEISPDGKVITLHLRKGIKFTDGTDFNAEAVKFNLELAKKNKINSSEVLENITSYNIPDPYTIKFNLAKYNCTFLLTLAQTPVGLMASPTAMQKPTIPDNITQVHMVGTGPFMFDSWQRDNYLRVKKNPNYWQKGQPYLDGIEFRNVNDVTVSIMSFKAKETNCVMTIDPIDAVNLKKEGYQIVVPPMHLIHSLCPDGANPNSPFTNLKVRQALEYAIDKKGMAEGIGMGYFEPVTQFAAKSDGWYDPNIPAREYNVQKAKQLLAEAGYPNGIKTKLVTDVRVRQDTLVAVQTYLKEAGFDCTLDKTDMARSMELTVKGWEGILMQGFPTVVNTAALTARFYTPTYPSMYRPAGWNQKWEAMLSQVDDKERIKQLKGLVRIMFDEAMIIPYQSDSSRAVLDGTVVGFAETYQINNMADYWEPGIVYLTK